MDRISNPIQVAWKKQSRQRERDKVRLTPFRQRWNLEDLFSLVSVGGLSTGPKTPEGRERCRHTAPTKRGRRTLSHLANYYKSASIIYLVKYEHTLLLSMNNY